MKPLTWRVEGSKGNLYTITLDNGVWTCECMDYLSRHHLCRHIKAVNQLQRLALLDKEAVDLLEALAKQHQQAEPPEIKPKSMSVKEKLDATFEEE